MAGNVEARDLNRLRSDKPVSHTKWIVLCVSDKHEGQKPLHFLRMQVNPIRDIGITARSFPSGVQELHEV